ncbi:MULTISPECIES: zinc-binding dehydrogenase [Paenibacillus]|uniref:zinc-binding dehydrogenase n=1 Tax=Paenibacillus TaxID=44249 RepID=UPI0027D9A988|nr:zinc-binding dehydrogenase [Paenibacillus illinoisensis]
MGADQVIHYRKEKFEEILKDIDLVFDTMGGVVAENSYKVLKPNTGRLITKLPISRH